MSLRDEISALRVEIAARPHRTRAEATGLAEATGPSNSSSSAHGQHSPDGRLDAEELLKFMNETLNEFSEELDKFPRLTALAALGVGLAVGVIIGRQLR